MIDGDGNYHSREKLLALVEVLMQVPDLNEVEVPVSGAGYAQCTMA
jgi:hypothetical protein